MIAAGSLSISFFLFPVYQFVRNGHESDGIGKTALPQLQDRPPQARGAGDLQKPAAQAASGLKVR
jgi:hypothetical protein